MKLTVSALGLLAILTYTRHVASEQYVFLSKTSDPSTFEVEPYNENDPTNVCTYASVVLGEGKRVTSSLVSCVGDATTSPLTYTFGYDSTQTALFNSVTDDAGNVGTCIPHCACQKKRSVIALDEFCSGPGCSWTGDYDCSISKDYVRPVKTTTTKKTTTKKATTTKKTTTTKKCPYKTKTVTKTVTKVITKTKGSGTVCTGGFYYGKGNGRGPAGSCCHDQSDCIDDCRSHRCTK